jgi:hypothetical protein
VFNDEGDADADGGREAEDQRRDEVVQLRRLGANVIKIKNKNLHWGQCHDFLNVFAQNGFLKLAI